MSDAPRSDSPALPPELTDLALNDIGVLRRRAIEARILSPVLAALGEEFGHERVREIAAEAIAQIAREQGKAMAEAMGDDSLASYHSTLDNWQKGDALRLRVLQTSDDELSFDIVRCRYAEMYRAMGVPELGALLSCNRDGALMEGFNPDVKLTRTQTLMGGAAFCDFRYRKRDT